MTEPVARCRNVKAELGDIERKLALALGQGIFQATVRCTIGGWPIQATAYGFSGSKIEWTYKLDGKDVSRYELIDQLTYNEKYL